MNPNYLNQWPESYAIDRGAVRDHLYGRERIGDPTSWRRCAEYFDGGVSGAGCGICYWMTVKHTPGQDLDRANYEALGSFFRVVAPGRCWIWPTYYEFAPRRAALCRKVAALLEELQLNPPADEPVR